MWNQTEENCGINGFIDYLMVSDTVEILWNLCGIYEKIFVKIHGPTAYMDWYSQWDAG